MPYGAHKSALLLFLMSACFAIAPIRSVAGSGLDDALANAVLAQNVAAVKILLEGGASPNASQNLFKEPVICTASRSTTTSALTIVEVLVKYKASLNVTCSSQDSPLIMATRVGNGELVKVLVAGGAQPLAMSTSGDTAGDVARVMNQRDVEDALGTAAPPPTCNSAPPADDTPRSGSAVLETPVVPGGELTGVAFSDNGELFAMAGSDGTATLWSTASGRKLRTFAAHHGSISWIKINTERQLLITASTADQTLKMWRLTDGRKVFEVANLAAPAWDKTPAVLIGSYGTVVAFAGRRELIAWRVADCHEIARATLADDARDLAGGAGNVVAIPEKAGVEIWTPGSHRPKLLESLPRVVTAVSFSADGSHLLTAGALEKNSDAKVINLWNISTGEYSKSTFNIAVPGDINVVAFSANGSSVLITNLSEARVMRISDGMVVNDEKLESYPSAASAVPFKPCFLTVGFGSDFVRENAATSIVASCGPKPEAVKLFDAEPLIAADEHFMVARSGNLLAYWNFDDGTARRIPVALGTAEQADEQVSAVAFHAPSARLFAGTTAGRIMEIDLSTGAIRNARRANSCAIDIMAIVGEQLLVSTGQFANCKEPPSINAFALSQLTPTGGNAFVIPKTMFPTHLLGNPDGSMLYAVNQLGGYEAWNLASRSLRKLPVNLRFAADSGASFALLPTGFEAVGLGDFSRHKGVVIIDPTGATGPTLIGANIKSSLADLHADEHDRLIIGGGSSGQIYVWNIDTGELVRQGADRGAISHLAANRDGRWLVSGLTNGTMSIWDREARSVRAHLVMYGDGLHEPFRWLITTPDGRYDSNSPGDLPGVSWVLPSDPLTPLPVESFMKDYYEPRLLVKVLSGEHLPPVEELEKLNRVQPEVRIVSVNAEGDGRTVSVSVEVHQGHRKVGAATNAPVVSTAVVQDLRVFRDGQLVAYAPTQSGAIVSDPGGGKVIKLPSIEIPSEQRGKTVEFSAYAFNESWVKSLTARYEYQVKPTFKQRPSRAYVISLGLNEYGNSRVNPLKYAADDACEMQHMLGDALQASQHYEAVVKVLLISGTCFGAGTNHPTRADKEHIQAVFDLLAGRPVSARLKADIENSDQLQRANPEDLVLITYSGHGTEDDAGQFYLVPYDVAGGATPSPTIDYRRLISSDELSLWLRDVDARDMTMIIDACESASSVDTQQFRPGPMGSRGLGQLAYDKGMRILAASQAEAVALESSNLHHGILTYALLNEGLVEGKADLDPQDGRITEAKWLKYGVKRVPKLYTELAANTFKGRGFRRANVVASGASVSVQKPALFDFRPSGYPDEVFTVLRTHTGPRTVQKNSAELAP
jgi:WD40 repeat protein/uncharacterized caspase-like protein